MNARLLRGLGLLDMGSLAFIMVAMPLDAEAVFIHTETLSTAEMVMLLGFGIVLVFNLWSVAWLIRQAKAYEDGAFWSMAAMGLFCLILMLAEKVMIDEVAHEWQPGGGLETEAVILYVLLLIQLVYVVRVIRLLSSASTAT